MNYKLTTLDKNIISALWKRAGQCQAQDVFHAAPDLNESSFLLYIKNLAKKTGFFTFIDLPTGDMPRLDTVLQMEPEVYAMWWA